MSQISSVKLSAYLRLTNGLHGCDGDTDHSHEKFGVTKDTQQQKKISKLVTDVQRMMALVPSREPTMPPIPERRPPHADLAMPRVKFVPYAHGARPEMALLTNQY